MLAPGSTPLVDPVILFTSISSVSITRFTCIKQTHGLLSPAASERRGFDLKSSRELHTFLRSYDPWMTH